MENYIIWGDLHSRGFNFDEFKCGELHERHEVATGNFKIISAVEDRGKTRKPMSKWPTLGHTTF
jgi:hypothetical protein